MSIAAVHAAIRFRRASLGARMVLVALAEYADNEAWEAWPSVMRLAAELGVSRRQIQLHLRSLQELGALIDTGRQHNRATVYRISLTSGTAEERKGLHPSAGETDFTLQPRKGETGYALEGGDGRNRLRSEGETDFAESCETDFAQTIIEPSKEPSGNARATSAGQSDAPQNRHMASLPTSAEPEPPPPPGDDIPLDRHGQPYAFAGRVIRLTQRDFDQWQRAYSALDLKSELTALDAWAATDWTDAERKRWFPRISAVLASKHDKRRHGQPHGNRGSPAGAAPTRRLPQPEHYAEILGLDPLPSR